MSKKPCVDKIGYVAQKVCSYHGNQPPFSIYVSSWVGEGNVTHHWHQQFHLFTCNSCYHLFLNKKKWDLLCLWWWITTPDEWNVWSLQELITNLTRNLTSVWFSFISEIKKSTFIMWLFFRKGIDWPNQMMRYWELFSQRW